jgi:hypothetical protein
MEKSGHLVFSWLEQLGLCPAANPAIPATVANALFLHHRKTDQACAVDGDVGLERLKRGPIIGNLRGGNRRPVAAGKGKLQALLA